MIDLTPQQLAIVRRILAQVIPGREVRAFGSRVRWESKPYSDLDLVVMPGDTPLPRQWSINLKEAFEESDLTFSVDLVEWERLSDRFRQIIQRQYEVVQAADSKQASPAYKAGGADAAGRGAGCADSGESGEDGV